MILFDTGDVAVGAGATNVEIFKRSLDGRKGARLFIKNSGGQAIGGAATARVQLGPSMSAGVKASHETNLGAANDDLRFEAKNPGLAGNSIRIRYVVSGNNTPLSVSMAAIDGQGRFADITINVATNGGGSAISTAAQVMAAVNADVNAGAMVVASLKTGNDGTGIVSAFSFVNLASGADDVFDHDTTTFASLAAGAIKALAITDAVEVLRFECDAGGGGATTVRAWVDAPPQKG